MNPALLKGKKVVGAEGHILGEVESININTKTWQASTFYVDLSDEATSELGFKKPFLSKITICLPTRLVNAVGEVLTLKETIRNLKNVAEKGKPVVSPEIKGKKVTGTKGYTLGEVEGFDVDLTNWQITGLQVGLTDDSATELGFKRPFLSKVAIIVPSQIVSSIGNFVTLDEAIHSLESLVECIRSCQKRS